MRANTKIFFELFDTEAKENSTPTVSNSSSSAGILKSEAIDRNAYATTEHNGFCIDGGMTFLSSGIPAQIFSDELSGADGTYANPVMVTVTFSETVTTTGVTLYFSDYDIAKQVRIAWYSGPMVLSQKVYYPDTGIYFCKNNVSDYDKLVITLYSSQATQHYLKLCGIDFGHGIEFTADNIIRAEATSTVDMLCDEIAINGIEFTIADVDKIFSASDVNSEYFGVQQNQRIKVKTVINGEETDIGTYYLEELTEKTIKADFKAQDAIGLLDSEEIPESYYNMNFSAFCAELLNGYDYILSPELADKTIRGYLNNGSKRQALQQACFAVGAVADTFGDGRIKIYTPSERQVKLISNDMIYAGGYIESIKQNRKLTVTVHNFDTDGNDTPTTQSIVINSKGVGEVKIDSANFVNADNIDSVLERVREYYQSNVRYVFNLPVNSQYEMADYLMAYMKTSYVRGNLTEYSLNLSGGVRAEMKVLGTVYPIVNGDYLGEIYAGERGVL